VLENHARFAQTDLDSWLSTNSLPCLCDCNYGGMRVFLFKSGENLVLASKSGGLYTPSSNPKVFLNVTEFTHAPHRFILDGEYLPNEGIHLFDVLRVDDRDLRSQTLENRRIVLNEIIDGMNIGTLSTIAPSVQEIFEFRDRCVSLGYQGAIVKNLQSHYGTQEAWLELRRNDTLCCFVTELESTSRDFWRWSLGLLDEKNGKLVNLGTVSSYSEKVKPRKISIGSVVEIRFSSLNGDMKLVDPFIIRIRHDRAPSECVLAQLDYALNILKPRR
jgi:ATP-dependent DNA ligase